MKIHSIYSSRKELLATFITEAELVRFIRRHCRTADTTTILTTIADSWNELNEVTDTTSDWMEIAWNLTENKS
jgi:hypothetical protein